MNIADNRNKCELCGCRSCEKRLRVSFIADSIMCPWVRVKANTRSVDVHSYIHTMCTPSFLFVT